MKSNAEINKSLHTKMGRCWHLLEKGDPLYGHFKCSKCGIFTDDYYINPDYTSDSSPRSLLAEVEAEIERRGKATNYVRAIQDLYIQMYEKFPYGFYFLNCPAEIRARAAEEVL